MTETLTNMTDEGTKNERNSCNKNNEKSSFPPQKKNLLKSVRALPFGRCLLLLLLSIIKNIPFPLLYVTARFPIKSKFSITLIKTIWIFHLRPFSSAPPPLFLFTPPAAKQEKISKIFCDDSFVAENFFKLLIN